MAYGARRHGSFLAATSAADNCAYLVGVRPTQKAWVDVALVFSKPADEQSWLEQLQNMPLSFFALLGTL
jgi:hypothetical protein